ncbi:MAG: hypothetical protein QNJ13_11885 [Paracoccaceae bacterium]|nr:hypothetical protein [Paracoccaceae bacterium]
MPNINDMFVVNLQLQAEGSVVVRSCELLHKDYRNRVSFTKLPDLFTVFTTRLAKEIRALLDEFGGSRNIVSKPDYSIDLPDLKLAGLSFLVSAVKDGVRHIILRFRYFIGSFQTAFALDLGLSSPTLPHKERIAIESLVDIVGPLYGLALLEDRRQLTDAEKVEVEHALRDLQGKAHVLKFYSDLLIRYVRDCAGPYEGQSRPEHLGEITRLRLVE